MVAQLSQHDCQPNSELDLCSVEGKQWEDLKTKYALSEQQAVVFVMVDKVGRGNDESLSLSPRPKEKHTFCQVTHYSKRHSPLV